MLIECGDGVTSIKRRRRDLSSDGVKKLTTTSGRDLEYTAGRNLKGLHGEGKLWETIEDCVQCDKQCDMRGLRWRIQAHKVTLHVIPPFRKFFKENERNFSEAGDGVRIYPDGVVVFDEKKIGSS
ncbi:hypothetical protein Tco_1163446 [Tanacetum coccineum]